MKRLGIIGFALALTLLLPFGPALAAEVRISAAGSLTDAIKELVEGYRQSHPEVELLPNIAASGALAKQIIVGAPADIFISANPKWMEYLQQKGLIAAGSEQVLLFNSLVLVGPPESSVRSLQDLPALQRIALGSPQSVPAGKYTEQALTAAGIYPQLLAERKLVLTKDVRQALLYADRGEVGGAFVYRTDALLAKQAIILLAVPQELYPRINYPAALTEAGADNPAAQAFFRFLFSAEAQRIFRNHGFLTP